MYPPFQISKIKESNIEDNPLEKEEERKSCIFVQVLCVDALIRVSTNIFLSKFSSSTPHPPFEKFLDPRLKDIPLLKDRKQRFRFCSLSPAMAKSFNLWVKYSEMDTSYFMIKPIMIKDNFN